MTTMADTLYFVPSDLDVTSLDSIDEPWEIVYMVVDWIPVVRSEEHEAFDGDKHSHEDVHLYPVALGSASHAVGGFIPAKPYFGDGYVTGSRSSALTKARSEIRKLKRQREGLHASLDAMLSDGETSPS